MTLTIAIPSYRRPVELRRVLEALRRQERPGDEVIVVARGEDLQTHEIVREFLSELPLRLQVVEGEGVVRAMNKAFESTTSDLIAFLDDDAIPYPDWAKKIVHAFENEPNLSGLGGRDHVFVDGRWLDGEEPVVGIVSWYGRAIGNHHLGVGPRRDVDCLKGVNMAFRMDAVGTLRVDSRLRGTGAQCYWEMMLCLTMRAGGKRLAYDPSIVVDHLIGERHDEDQRDHFNALAYENRIHNLTLALLEYLHPAGQILLLSYAMAIGIGNGYCGLLKGLLYWPKVGPRQALEKTTASVRGTYAGWRTWRAGKIPV